LTRQTLPWVWCAAIVSLVIAALMFKPAL